MLLPRVANFIAGTLYPIYGSMKAIEENDTQSMIHWISFFIISSSLTAVWNATITIQFFQEEFKFVIFLVLGMSNARISHLIYKHGLQEKIT
jgi:hypothetical protein